MVGYVFQRALQGVATLCALVLVTFVLMHAVPGGPFEAGAGSHTSAAVVQAQRVYYGLNDALPTQFARYLGHLLRGDLGPSLVQPGRSVADVLRGGLLPSALLGGMAFAIVIGFGVPLGVLAAVRGGVWDAAVLGVTTVFAAVPGFVLAFVLLLVGAVWLGWFDVRLGRGFGESLASLPRGLPPAIALAAPSTALVARVTRVAMLEVLASDYVRTARAKGLGWRAIYLRHALRNALVPVLTLAGPVLATLVTGSIVVEVVFGMPGIGTAFVNSVLQRDYGVIMGTTLFYAAVIVVANAAVDCLYPLVDPRIARP